MAARTPAAAIVHTALIVDDRNVVIAPCDGLCKQELEELGFAASGLTPVMAGRLFDRFYTVESGRHATGLGLTIAKHLTEAMGGRIRADCRGGRLTIALSFPAEPSKREGVSCSTPYFCDTM